MKEEYEGQKKVTQKCSSCFYSIIFFTQKRDLEIKLKYRIIGLYQTCSLIRKDRFRNIETKCLRQYQAALFWTGPCRRLSDQGARHLASSGDAKVLHGCFCPGITW